MNRLTQTNSAVGSTVVSSHQNSTINALDQRKRTDLADEQAQSDKNLGWEITVGALISIIALIAGITAAIRIAGWPRAGMTLPRSRKTRTVQAFLHERTGTSGISG